MNVVHVVEAWKGGIASYVNSIINEQIKLGYKVHLICDEEILKTDLRKSSDVKIHTYFSSRNPIKFFSVRKDIIQILDGIAPDIVHAHSSFPGIYLRLKSLGYKLIYTPHAWSFSQKNKTLFVKLAYKYIEKILSRKCHSIMCISQDEVDMGLSAGIKPIKLKKVYTGLQDKESQPIKPRPKIRVGFFGRLDYQKGFDLLLTAVPMIDDKFEIHIFGDNVRNQDSVQVPDRVKMHGWIDSDEIHRKMTSMDVIIIPSRWEGFAIVPLEAMRAGRAVIVSRHSSLSEVVIDGYNGQVIYNDEPSAIATIVNQLSYETLEVFGKKSREIYESAFNISKFIKNVNGVYFE